MNRTPHHEVGASQKSRCCRVVVISDSYLPVYAGWLQQTLRMISACDKRRLTFTWIFRKSDSQPIPPTEDITLRPLRIPSSRSRWVARLLFGVRVAGYLIANRKAYEVIYCPLGYFPTEIVAMIARLIGRPVVARVAGSELAVSYRAGRRRRALLARLVSALVVLNRTLYEELVDRGIRRIYWHPNGVELGRFRPTSAPLRRYARRKWQMGENDQPIVFVGAIVPAKGVDVLVTAFSNIAARHPGSTLWLAGPVPRNAMEPAEPGSHADFVERLQTIAEQSGFAHRVKIVGEVSDVAELLQAAEIFVLPSWSEGMPNALLEAMASGLACIASDIPACRQLLLEDGADVLFPPGDASSLAAALDRLLADPVRRAALGQSARTRVERGFALENCARSYQDLFLRLGSAESA
jgi:glycosyltransferase involved in cell wall biosynthesis